MIGCALPFPPSVNSIWRAVDGRNILSKSYRAWRAHAAQVIALKRPGTIAGPYTISILADRPDRRRRDLDNLLKPVGDALQQSGVIVNDCDAQRITIAWSKRTPGKDAKVWVVLEAAE